MKPDKDNKLRAELESLFVVPTVQSMLIDKMNGTSQFYKEDIFEKIIAWSNYLEKSTNDWFCVFNANLGVINGKTQFVTVVLFYNLEPASTIRGLIFDPYNNKTFFEDFEHQLQNKKVLANAPYNFGRFYINHIKLNDQESSPPAKALVICNRLFSYYADINFKNTIASKLLDFEAKRIIGTDGHHQTLYDTTQPDEQFFKQHGYNLLDNDTYSLKYNEEAGLSDNLSKHSRMMPKPHEINDVHFMKNWYMVSMSCIASGMFSHKYKYESGTGLWSLKSVDSLLADYRSRPRSDESQYEEEEKKESSATKPALQLPAHDKPVEMEPQPIAASIQPPPISYTQHKRMIYPYSANLTSSTEFKPVIKNKHDKKELVQLYQDQIRLHAARRVELFFMLLIAYSEKNLKPDIAKTVLQHGQAHNKREIVFSAAHRSVITALADNSKGDWILTNTFLQQELNATDLLPHFVNEFDSQIEIDRQRYVKIIHEVSNGKIDPIKGLLNFLTILDTRLKYIQHYVVDNHGVLPELLKYTREGSFDFILVNFKKLNPAFLKALLGMTDAEEHLDTAQHKQLRTDKMKDIQLSLLTQPSPEAFRQSPASQFVMLDMSSKKTDIPKQEPEPWSFAHIKSKLDEHTTIATSKLSLYDYVLPFSSLTEVEELKKDKQLIDKLIASISTQIQEQPDNPEIQNLIIKQKLLIIKMKKAVTSILASKAPNNNALRYFKPTDLAHIRSFDVIYNREKDKINFVLQRKKDKKKNSSNELSSSKNLLIRPKLDLNLIPETILEEDNVPSASTTPPTKSNLSTAGAKILTKVEKRKLEKIQLLSKSLFTYTFNSSSELKIINTLIQIHKLISVLSEYDNKEVKEANQELIHFVTNDRLVNNIKVFLKLNSDNDIETVLEFSITLLTQLNIQINSILTIQSLFAPNELNKQLHLLHGIMKQLNREIDIKDSPEIQTLLAKRQFIVNSIEKQIPHITSSNPEDAHVIEGLESLFATTKRRNNNKTIPDKEELSASDGPAIDENLPQLADNAKQNKKLPQKEGISPALADNEPLIEINLLFKSLFNHAFNVHSERQITLTLKQITECVAKLAEYDQETAKELSKKAIQFITQDKLPHEFEVLLADLHRANISVHQLDKLLEVSIALLAKLQVQLNCIIDFKSLFEPKDFEFQINLFYKAFKELHSEINSQLLKAWSSKENPAIKIPPNYKEMLNAFNQQELNITELFHHQNPMLIPSAHILIKKINQTDRSQNFFMTGLDHPILMPPTLIFDLKLSLELNKEWDQQKCNELISLLPKMVENFKKFVDAIEQSYKVLTNPVEPNFKTSVG
ncbi:MAG: hypothetical protein P4L65_03130 [Legionella sp.]|nr:hypothetical protein [Legionella sp.]